MGKSVNMPARGENPRSTLRLFVLGKKTLNNKLLRKSRKLKTTVFSSRSLSLLSFRSSISANRFAMATTESNVATTETAKIDLFEDDDEFEEFQIDEEWDKDEGNEAAEQWEDDWDDDDVNDDFSLQLRKELESNSQKS